MTSPRLRLVKRLKKHGLKETEAGITMKLKRGTFSATFFLASLVAMELEGVSRMLKDVIITQGSWMGPLVSERK
jgi:hypothetical protein